MGKKEDFAGLSFMEKKGQVTIFIIVALVIVAAGILVYTFVPGLRTGSGTETQNPNSFIDICLREDIENIVETVSIQGGSMEPEFYFTFNGVNIEYLCYTSESYKTCVVQRPLLRQHVKNEIEDEIKPIVRGCFNSLKESYEGKGYEVDMSPGNTIVEFLPGKISTKMDYTLTLTKGGSNERFDSFDIVLNNNLYELMNIAVNIVEWEATVGEAEATTYMALYPNLKVEKNLREDGTRIYTLTNRNTGNKFQFAIRSLVFPPGF